MVLHPDDDALTPLVDETEDEPKYWLIRLTEEAMNIDEEGNENAGKSWNYTYISENDIIDGKSAKALVTTFLEEQEIKHPNYKMIKWYSNKEEPKYNLSETQDFLNENLNKIDKTYMFFLQHLNL